MHAIFRYLAKRLLLLVPVVLTVVTLTFVLSHVVPGDPARLFAGLHAPLEQVEKARIELGLDKPLWEQYLIHWARLFSGDLGLSIHTRRPVTQDLMDCFPRTIELTIVAMNFTVLFGIPLGVISALNKDRRGDHASRLFSLAGVSMPIFWLGILAQLSLGHFLGLLPISGNIDPMVALLYPTKRITGFLILDSLITANIQALLSALSHILLPALVLSFQTLAISSRMTRALMLEVLDQDYIRTARSLGIPERLVIYKYALKNALIPVMTIVSLSFGYLLGGSFLVETVFDWPGVGRYVTESIVTLDYPAILGAVTVTCIVYVLINLAVDLLYAYMNPKIRY